MTFSNDFLGSIELGQICLSFDVVCIEKSWKVRTIKLRLKLSSTLVEVYSEVRIIEVEFHSCNQYE